MSSSTPFLDAIISSFPAGLSKSLTALQTPEGAQTLDTLIRFIGGGGPPYPEPTWSDKQREAVAALSALTSQSTSATNGKRQREQENESEQTSKRQKTESSDDGLPQVTLHTISTTSPVRKKVDITVYETSVKFVNAATGAVESSISLSDLSRAFLLPTRGKMKAHWTVVILSSDVPERGKKPATAAPQIIFGLDARASSPVKYSTYSGSTPELTTLKGGAPTRGVLLDFIARLRLEVLEPVAAVFKSACVGIAASASEDGVPGVEAYRAAKAGTLWFGSFGVLWGESKPCEFWPLESLLSKDEGLRMISATGRTCTVVLTRKSPPEDLAQLEADEKDPGVETAFSMVDGKEQEGINQWVREHRNLFGKEKVVGAAAALQVQDDSDEEDGDFAADSESDGGSPSASSGEESSENDESGSDDAEDSDGDGENEAGEEGDAEGDADEELRPENHPLMRPGAMARMSRAAIEMAAAIVTGDLMGDMEDDGEDELDD